MFMFRKSSSTRIFLVLLLIPLLSVNNATGSEPVIANSRIVAPDTANVLTSYEVLVWAGDVSNASSGSFEVFLEVSDGTFTQTGNNTVIANTTAGLLTVEWNAPSISSLVDFENVSLHANIDDGLLGFDIYEYVTLSHETNIAIQNSEHFITTTMISGQTYDLSTRVKDGFGSVVSDITVDYTSSDGNITDSLGQTDAFGFYNTTFVAPVFPSSIPSLNITINATIRASNSIELTLSQLVNVTQSTAQSLTVTVNNPSEVASSSLTNLQFHVLAESDIPTGANITLSATAGTFSNGNFEKKGNVNSSGYSDFLWTAPTVTDNTTVSFTYNVYYLELTSTADFDILVVFSEGNLRLEYSIEKTSFKQNETNSVEISVINDDTDQIVPNVDVNFLTNMGIWQENELDSYIGTTDINGNSTATFNGSQLILLLEQNIIVVNASVNVPEFNPVEISFNFTLIRIPPTYNYTVGLALNEIEYGDSINILLNAKINNLAYVNATFALVTSAGTFSNSETSIRERTDSSGALAITWDSGTVTKIIEETKVYITVELVNSGLDILVIEITINPIELPTTSGAPTSPPEGGLDTPMTAGLIASGVVIVGVVTYFIVQRKK